MAKKQVFKEAEEKLKAGADVLKKLESYYTKLEDFNRVARQIEQRCLNKLNASLKSMVIGNYSKGGIKEKTGELMKAVSESYCTIDKKGILRVSLGAGYDRDVYVRAGVFRKYKDWFELTSGQKNQLMNEYTTTFLKECNEWCLRMAKSSGL